LLRLLNKSLAVEVIGVVLGGAVGVIVGGLPDYAGLHDLAGSVRWDVVYGCPVTIAAVAIVIVWRRCGWGHSSDRTDEPVLCGTCPGSSR